MSQTAIKFGGAKRKNGHKMNCECHICQNMKNKAKRGGYEEDAEKERLKKMGGPTKKNGHKPNCNCPICKNMRNAKKSGKTVKSMKTGKKSNGHKMNCKCPICKNMGKKSRKGGAGAETEADAKDYDGLHNVPEANTDANTDTNTTDTNTTDTNATANTDTTNTDTNTDTTDTTPTNTDFQKGGRKRKTIRKRGNGHKANCMCPICKNMRKGTKKTRRR